MKCQVDVANENVTYFVVLDTYLILVIKTKYVNFLLQFIPSAGLQVIKAS